MGRTGNKIKELEDKLEIVEKDIEFLKAINGKLSREVQVNYETIQKLRSEIEGTF